MWRIIVRAYDTKVFTPELAREIRLLTGRTRWEAYRITAGIVAGTDEVCLIDGLGAEHARCSVEALQAAGFMARSEPANTTDVEAAGLPRIRTVLSGLFRR